MVAERQRKRPYNPDKHCGGLCADGLPCTRGKGERTDHPGFGHCWIHFGRSDTGNKHAATERALGEFGALVAEQRIKVEGRSHYDVLTESLADTGSIVEALKVLLSEQNVKAEWRWEEVKGPQGGRARWVIVESEGLIGVDAQGQQRISVLLDELGKYLTLYVKTAKVAAELGLEDRKVRVLEQQLDLVTQAVSNLLAERGLPAKDVQDDLVRHLRLVDPDTKKSA